MISLGRLVSRWGRTSRTGISFPGIFWAVKKRNSSLRLSRVDRQIRGILSQYQEGFSSKTYGEENDDHDVLMDAFGITPALKRENRQYWGRELGMCWQRIVCEVFSGTRDDYQRAWKVGGDEPCDCGISGEVIDTKYRIGSGDSGTLKKFRKYGKMFRGKGVRPILLILREDNLPAAMKACRDGGWEILTGKATFSYIKDKTGVDLEKKLTKLRRAHLHNRQV